MAPRLLIWVRSMRRRHEQRLPEPECCVEERDEWRKDAASEGIITLRRLPRANEPTKRCGWRCIVRCRHKMETCTQPSFARFMDLPVELRERVYELYFQDHGKKRLTPFKLPPVHGDRLEDKYYYKSIPPHEPALAFTSRSIRAEALKVFYSNYQFPLPIHLELLSPFSTVDWYHRLSPSKVRLIKHLELHFCFEKFPKKYSGIRAADAFFIDIDFDARLNTYAMSVRVPEGHGPIARAFSRPRSLISRHVEKVLDEIMLSPGLGNFTAEDFDRLVPD